MRNRNTVSPRLTAAEPRELVGQRLREVRVAGAYRDPGLLTPSGITRKLETCGAGTRFAADPRHRCRRGCARCSPVDEIHGAFGDLLRVNFRNLNGYGIIGHPLDAGGICPACRETVAGNVEDASPQGQSHARVCEGQRQPCGWPRLRRSGLLDRKTA